MKNGVCDSGINIPQCIFDGGDCLGWHFVGPYLMEVLSGLHTFPEAKVGIIWLCPWRGSMVAWSCGYLTFFISQVVTD